MNQAQQLLHSLGVAVNDGIPERIPNGGKNMSFTKKGPGRYHPTEITRAITRRKAAEARKANENL